MTAWGRDKMAHSEFRRAKGHPAHGRATSVTPPPTSSTSTCSRPSPTSRQPSPAWDSRCSSRTPMPSLPLIIPGTQEWKVYRLHRIASVRRRRTLAPAGGHWCRLRETLLTLPQGDSMSPTLDPGRLRDPALRPIAEKVLEGARLSAADARVLYATTDLIGLGRLADLANQRRNGDRVFFSANQHINPTNVCVLRNTCTFCSFARMPKEEGGVHPVARGGLRRGGAGARHADQGVPHRRRPAPEAPAQLLHRHDPGPQGAAPARAHQGADRGRDRAPGADREDHGARRADRA